MNLLKSHRSTLLIFLFVIILGVSSAIALRKYPLLNNLIPSEAERVSFDKQSLPQLNFVDYKSGINYSQDVRQGNVLLIYLLPNCRGCQIEADILANSGLSQHSSLKIYGITNQNPDSIDQFAKDHNFTYPIFIDINDSLREKLNITFFPTNLILNEGIIEKGWVGSPSDVDELFKKIGISPNK